MQRRNIARNRPGNPLKSPGHRTPDRGGKGEQGTGRRRKEKLPLGKKKGRGSTYERPKGWGWEARGRCSARLEGVGGGKAGWKRGEMERGMGLRTSVLGGGGVGLAKNRREKDNKGIRGCWVVGAVCWMGSEVSV